MPKFLVTKGFHYDKNPQFGKVQGAPRFIQYPAGAEVEGPDDMMERFPNKLAPIVNDERPEVVTEARRMQVNELIQAGAYEERDRKFLETLPQAPFDRIRQRTLELFNRQAPPDKVSSPLGEDVTDTFQVAYDEGFKVFVNTSGKYQVTTKQDVKKALNKNALTKEGVEPFLRSFLEERR